MEHGRDAHGLGRHRRRPDPEEVGQASERRARPLRYSPSGKWMLAGWSAEAARCPSITRSALASAAAPATIFWKSSEPMAPEQEKVSSLPPGASSFIAHRLMSLYARAAFST